jgi:hypothetical protein
VPTRSTRTSASSSAPQTVAVQSGFQWAWIIPIPNHITDGQLIYDLAGDNDFEFYFANEETLLYYVGPPDSATKVAAAAAQGHTVIVGGVGIDTK